VVKIVSLSILLSFVLVAGWFVDVVSYHEPTTLQSLRSDVFETIALQIPAADDLSKSRESVMPR
jgi:hypothetical protein